eukprot:TRINITY_DN7592_c0_g1_i4.p1 TRINITY_DN7592_c0_g1~~TRINITY_DN7592_c0_g1_i4.p1  ORF type:complete len:347 (+),score=83.92 TRINITY_DN7592_c0_g1_i4:19-1059(+)
MLQEEISSLISSIRNQTAKLKKEVNDSLLTHKKLGSNSSISIGLLHYKSDSEQTEGERGSSQHKILEHLLSEKKSTPYFVETRRTKPRDGPSISKGKRTARNEEDSAELVNFYTPTMERRAPKLSEASSMRRNPSEVILAPPPKAKPQPSPIVKQDIGVLHDFNDLQKAFMFLLAKHKDLQAENKRLKDGMRTKELYAQQLNVERLKNARLTQKLAEAKSHYMNLVALVRETAEKEMEEESENEKLEAARMATLQTENKWLRDLLLISKGDDFIAKEERRLMKAEEIHLDAEPLDSNGKVEHESLNKLVDEFRAVRIRQKEEKLAKLEKKNGDHSGYELYLSLIHI